jgi:hypothetical protein
VQVRQRLTEQGRLAVCLAQEEAGKRGYVYCTRISAARQLATGGLGQGCRRFGRRGVNHHGRPEGAGAIGKELLRKLARLAKNSYVKTGWSVFMLFPVRKDRRYFKIQGNFLGGIDALKK